MELNIKKSITENGFVILRNVFSETELSNLRSKVIEILTDHPNVKHDPLDKYYLSHRTDNGVLYDVFQRYPVFQPFVRNHLLLDAVEQYLGANFYLYVNSFLYKPQGVSNEVPFHQDFLSRPKEDEKLLAWIAVDNATKDNGCLKVIPGSHKEGFREWFRVEGETHHDRIKISPEEEQEAIKVELNAGDVLLFSNYLIHGSDQNNTPDTRMAYRIVFKSLNKAEIPRATPIMLRGGYPEYVKTLSDLTNEIGTIETNKTQKSEKNFIQKLINKIGYRLTRI